MKLGSIPAAACAVVVCAAIAAPAAGSAPARVAYARSRHVLVYRSPSAKRPVRALPNPYHGTLFAFLVRRVRPRWLHVFLPVRPNGSSGWVRRSQVLVLRDQYRVRVELRRHRLSVWRSGRLVMRQPVGVGRPGTPTPVGRYYLVELIQTDDPQGPYGPYAFGLSAHSDVLQRFDGGDGQVGIHGTNFLQGLGTDVSHGCIRIGNAAIVRLARTLPLGTPVTIVGGARPARPPHARPPVAGPISAPLRPSPAARAAPPQPRTTPGWAVAFRRYVDELLAFLHLE